MKIRKRACISLLIAAATVLTACSNNKEHEMAMCALTDVSGTYAKEKGHMINIIQAGILPKLLPGDNLAVIEINSSSYSEDNFKARLRLDYRPSKANAQRLAFAKTLKEFAAEPGNSRHTDISGAMMLCGGYLKSTEAGTKVMIIFSDMKEELKPGLKRKFSSDEFKGIDIAAINVIKLQQDNINPQIYRSRMAKWQKSVTTHGAKSWDGELKPEDMGQYLDALR